MNSADNAFPQPQHTPQKPVASFKLLKSLATIAAVLLIGLVAGTGGYLLGSRNNRSTPISQPSPSPQTAIITQILPTTDNTITVIIQDDYFFNVTIPHGYALIKGEGDYIRYVTDRSGEKIIRFYISSAGGEPSPAGQTVIDGVPFIVEYAFNRGIIGCNAGLFANNAQFELDHLYFGIYTRCKDANDKQSDVYEQVIRSIQFSEDLKSVLLGKSPPPKLRY